MRARCMGWGNERVLSGNTVTLALVALASGLQRSTRMRIHFTVSSLLLIGLYVIQAVSISKDKCGAFRLILREFQNKAVVVVNWLITTS